MPPLTYPRLKRRAFAHNVEHSPVQLESGGRRVWDRGLHRATPAPVVPHPSQSVHFGRGCPLPLLCESFLVRSWVKYRAPIRARLWEGGLETALHGTGKSGTGIYTTGGLGVFALTRYFIHRPVNWERDYGSAQ